MGRHLSVRVGVLALTSCLAATLLVTSPAAAGKHDVPAPGTEWGDAKVDSRSIDGWTGDNDPKKDPGSLYTITEAIGARDVWKREDAAGRAITGRGVTVAVVDSGVSAVPGLDAPGKVVQGPDLSFEVNAQPAITDTDTYGHGTHMAGIIAAKDPVQVDAKTGEPKPSKPYQQLGVAPDAQVLGLKLASTDGSTDVSQVIAALDWVVQHQDDNGMDVRVVNLSFGTTSLQDYQVDPLAAAAENAWHSGLVVVVSGGNDGSADGRLTNPAIDPYVIAVGSSDPNDKVDGWHKGTRVADYSSWGTDARPVDLLAPGKSVASLRDPGSYVDTQHPEGRVSGDDTGRLFRGSGTSQAAAVVSGAAALLLQAYPELTPDQVKAALVGSASEVKHAERRAAGAGQVDVKEALKDIEDAYKAKDPSTTLLAADQQHPLATANGSLEAARGGSTLVDPETGAPLVGEVDVQGGTWDGPSWFAQARAGTAWTEGSWNRARWSGEGWTSSGWSRARWSGDTWQRARWSDNGWERARWSRARWSDTGWTGNGWS